MGRCSRFVALLTLLAAPGIGAQAVDIRVTDLGGRAIPKTAVEILTHSSTIPILSDTIRSLDGRRVIRIPGNGEPLKLYVIEICADHYSSQFITAPFSPADTLRLAVQLAPLGGDSTRGLRSCAFLLDHVTRTTVTDTTRFVGLAAATNLEVERLAAHYHSLRDRSTNPGSVGARTLLTQTLATLRARLDNARSKSAKARTAYTIVALAFSVNDTLPGFSRARLRNALPPASKWWASEPYVVGYGGASVLFVPQLSRDTATFARNSGTGRLFESYLNQMVDAAVEPEIRSEAQSELVRLAYTRGDTSKAQLVLNQMLTETPNYPLTKYDASRYARNRPLREGATVPQFDFISLPDTARHITNASIAGKITLVDFWGTWCGPCVGAMPELHRIYEKYHSRGFQILSVAADESPETIAKFRTKWSMPWVNAFTRYSEGIDDNPELNRLGIVMFPKAVLVDAQGRIITELGGGATGIRELPPILDRLFH